MKNILVATDGSENAKRALETAKRLGEKNQSTINIVYVLNCMRNCHPYAMDLHYEEEINRIFLDQAKQVLEEAKEGFNDYSGKVNTFIRCGEPDKEILDKASIQKCDLIIMGSRGLNTISRVMLGSVSSRVINHSDIPVLIVK